MIAGPTVEIAVVGSLNLDISVSTPHLPVPGETVIGGDALWSPGGKGGNQAVAAARLGRRVAMVGAVGTDSAGETLLAGLDADRVVFAGVRLAEAPSGLAMIAVAADGSGENSIVVSPGSNGRLSPEVVRTSAAVRDAVVVLIQLEIPLDCVVATLACARGRVIINPAPAVPGAASAIAGASIVVPNRGELAALVGADEARSNDELVDQARQLDVPSIVVTLGADGALVVEPTSVSFVPSIPVDPVDTTAAGDTFCGALADALVGEADLVDAVSWAVRAAAVTVTRRGAQLSIPTRAQVEALG